MIRKLHPLLGNIPEIHSVGDFFKTRSLALEGYPDELLVFHHRYGESVLSDSCEIHNRYALIVTLKGEFRILLEGRAHRVGEGNAILLFPFQNHAFTAEGCDTITLCVTFTLQDDKGFNALRDHLFKPGENGLYLLRELLLGWNTPSPEKVWRCSSYLRELLMDAASEKVFAEPDYPPVLNELFQAFRSGELLRCNAKEIAARFNLCQNRLSALCRNYTGIPLGAYLRHLKLDCAVRLLSSDNLSVNEIAEQLGFESASAFCRLFKRQYAMTPGECRDRLMKGNIQLIYPGRNAL